MLILGDCIEKMNELAENSVDCVVTDPPYGWRFMGKAWDGADIEKTLVSKLRKTPRSDNHTWKRNDALAFAAGTYDFSSVGNFAFQLWTQEWATEALRVLKPGGHMLVFCGPRTYHRMATGVEDAGFEIRDSLCWLFGSGFPKSLDISKAIDKAAGEKPTVIGKSPNWRPAKTHGGAGFDREVGDGPATMNLTTPTTPDAKRWQGYGTALKPAHEGIVLARKPLSEKTVAKNVLKWGTGGLNIEGCRIGTELIENGRSGRSGGIMKGGMKPIGIGYKSGRFPANLILDEEAAGMLDEQTGILKNGGQNESSKSRGFTAFGKRKPKQDCMASSFAGDSGGASRFFYVAKSSRSERNAGLTREPEVTTDGREKPIDNPYLRGETARQNSHPTVKPLKLMRYLVRLVCPPNGVVLDPFLGSGTTGIAAKLEGFEFIGIEKEEQYLEIAKARIEHWQPEPESEQMELPA